MGGGYCRIALPDFLCWFYFPVQQTTSGIDQASSKTSGTDFNRHVPIIFFFSLSIYQSKRCDDSPASSRRVTQHNTHDEGCDLLEAGLQGRGPKIVLLAPEVGHRLAIVNLAHHIKGLLKIPNSIGMYIHTEILYFHQVHEGCATGLEE